MSENKIKVTTSGSGKLTIKPAKASKTKAAKQRPAKKPALSTVAGTTSKATLYVDIDDEITAIIEKVRDSKSSIIALVLPKRASVMQSIVNMKLLKRAAEQDDKNLVLVTTEASLLPLAGLVGLHVADTPTSKPGIPPLPDRPSDEPESVEEPLAVTDASAALAVALPDDFDPDAAGQTPVGELAGLPATPPSESVEEIVMDDDAGLKEDGTKPDVTPVRRNKKLAIPSFDAFRLRLFLGILLLGVLIAGWVFATKVLPKATVAIATNSQIIRSELNVTLDTAAKTVDMTNKIIPATAQSTQKTLSQQVAATGQQNNGDKATGKVTLTNCTSTGDTVTIPAGSGVSSGGMTFITQTTAVLDTSAFTSSGACKSLSDTSATVNVVALKAGESYNIAAGTFSISATGVTAKSSAAMTGGTDDIVKVVSQGDIDNAKSKIAAQDTAQLKKDLQAALQAKGLVPFPTTFIAGEQQVKTNANPGDTVDTVTVTATVPYTMLGAQQTDMAALVVASVKSQIDTKKQKILDDGVAKATYTQENPGTTTTAVVAAKAQSVAGPELSVDQLKQEVAGKKAGDIKESIGGLPGVTAVEVRYSPFWVSSAPKDVTKITIVIDKQTEAQ